MHDDVFGFFETDATVLARMLDGLHLAPRSDSVFLLGQSADVHWCRCRNDHTDVRQRGLYGLLLRPFALRLIGCWRQRFFAA